MRSSVSKLRALMRRACGASRSMREQFISFGGRRGDSRVDSSVLGDGRRCQSVAEAAANFTESTVIPSRRTNSQPRVFKS